VLLGQYLSLEDRTVPAYLDLTTPGASGFLPTDPNGVGAFFQQVDPQSTGTGVIDPFVRLQATGTEQGYNTDYRPLEFDEKTDATFTHSLKLSAIPQEKIDGVWYRKFLLDVNETLPGKLLSLDQLQISTAPSTKTLHGYSADGTYGGQATPRYDLDGAGDTSVLLNYALNHGSGSGDMFAYVPDSTFAGLNGNNTYVYLYSRFGDTAPSDAGFEEWAVVNGTLRRQTFSISGMKFEDANGDGVKGDAEPGLSGWAVNLFADSNGNGTLDAAEPLVGSTTTGAGGAYSFTGLDAAENYIVQEVNQAGWVQTYPSLLGGRDDYAVYLNSDVTGVDFGNFQLIQISGHKFNDRTGDGITGDDAALGGVAVNLFRDANGNGVLDGDDGAAVASTTTAAGTGAYSFTDLGPGTYFVREVVPTGWIQTAPAAPGYYTVIAASGVDVADRDFANFQLVNISGMKFNDYNTDGDRDAGEPGIQGWTIYLYRDSDQDGQLDADDPLVAATTTGADGAYTFADLGPGEYIVREAQLAGWIQVSVNPGPIVATSGASASGVDFGNVQIGAGGAHTLGYWSNQNGAATIAAMGGWDAVRVSLAGLYLRNQDGSLFDVAHASYSDFRAWLLGASGQNMAYMLSAQAAAMELNILAGAGGLSDPDGNAFPTGDRAVYAPGVTGASAAGFISVNNLLDQARNILYAGGSATLDLTQDGPDRAYATLVKTALDDANNNKIFVVIV
jgi:hypothetical protein